MKTAEIFIVGSGSLATGVVNALSQISAGPLRIAVIGRSMRKVGRLALVANARAAALRSSATFLPLEIAPFKASSFSRAIRSLKPKVIFQVASIQSPWESAREQNRWTKLLASAGFGITLPLQLVLAAEIARAASDSEVAVVNASYPDCVNPVFQRLGLRTTCGIGNCAIVEAFCRSQLRLGNADVRVVGHHGHFYGWLNGKESHTQPRTWVKGREIRSGGFHPSLGSIADELNNVTATTAVPVILSLLTGATLQASIPGVGEMPGGYPFLLKRGRFTLHLPSGISTAEAIAHNKTGERMDGLDLESGVKFVGKARRALSSVGFEYAEGFDLAEWQTVAAKMILLRNRLRLIRA